MQRESMEYDVVIVGAGPSGLSAAIKLKQLSPDTSVCVVEKGSEVGAHIVSGAVFESRALDELIPDWQDRTEPARCPVTHDDIYFLTGVNSAQRVPNWLAPKTFHNHGNFIISLGDLCRYLAAEAEKLEVDIFPGFSASQLLIDDNNCVTGIITGDMGRDKQGNEKPGFSPGMELKAKYTLFAEGCRGHLGKQLIQHFKLDENKDPQHYALGIKELWKVNKDKHQPGRVVHSAGWPLSETKTHGGGFMYHLDDQLVSIGLVVDLSYDNPHLSPFDEFQRFKHHPLFAEVLNGGQRISYGARAITKGGLQSQVKMSFPGGLLIGDNAGTLNFAKIKGTHTAMKCGMLAAEEVHQALSNTTAEQDLSGFSARYQASWAYQELHKQRNFGPAQSRFGNFFGSIYAFFDINLFDGRLPWTLRNPVADHSTLKTAAAAKKPNYSKPDGKISFDKLSSVYLSNTNHEEDQPCHLHLENPDIPLASNLSAFNEPAQRYCPAGVYEVVEENGKPRFQINAQNCVHCKTCDIKDPAQNITWCTPEGGGGPNYPNM